MKDALEMNIGGIKCDNPNCDYINMDVKLEEYEQWIDKPCPKCGENLFTEEDYRNTKLLIGMVDLMNNIFPKRKEDEETVTMTVDMNGSGDMKLNIED